MTQTPSHTHDFAALVPPPQQHPQSRPLAARLQYAVRTTFQQRTTASEQLAALATILVQLPLNVSSQHQEPGEREDHHFGHSYTIPSVPANNNPIAAAVLPPLVLASTQAWLRAWEEAAEDRREQRRQERDWTSTRHRDRNRNRRDDHGGPWMRDPDLTVGVDQIGAWMLRHAASTDLLSVFPGKDAGSAPATSNRRRSNSSGGTAVPTTIPTATTTTPANIVAATRREALLLAHWLQRAGQAVAPGEDPVVTVMYVATSPSLPLSSSLPCPIQLLDNAGTAMTPAVSIWRVLVRLVYELLCLLPRDDVLFPRRLSSELSWRDAFVQFLVGPNSSSPHPVPHSGTRPASADLGGDEEEDADSDVAVQAGIAILEGLAKLPGACYHAAGLRRRQPQLVLIVDLSEVMAGRSWHRPHRGSLAWRFHGALRTFAAHNGAALFVLDPEGRCTVRAAPA